LFGDRKGGGASVALGGALAGFVAVLAITGMIVFPIRYYRRRSNPYRVARNLVLSNLVFAVGISVGGALEASTLTDEGDSVNETRVYLVVGFLTFGLIMAAISFTLFFVLSKRRAKEAYHHGVERL
jgi:hypothetical protein